MSNMKKRIVAVILIVALLTSLIVINVSAIEYVPMPDDLDLPRTMAAVYELYEQEQITGDDLAAYLKPINVFNPEFLQWVEGADGQALQFNNAFGKVKRGQVNLIFVDLSVEFYAGDAVDALALTLLGKHGVAAVGLVVGQRKCLVAQSLSDQYQLMGRKACIGIGGMKMQIRVLSFHKSNLVF